MDFKGLLNLLRKNLKLCFMSYGIEHGFLFFEVKS
jgi:hypothetical protein